MVDEQLRPHSAVKARLRQAILRLLAILIGLALFGTGLWHWSQRF